MSSIKPKIGTCTVCNKTDKPLMKKMCCDGYSACYQKHKKQVYSERAKAKESQPKERVSAEDKSLPELLDLAQLVFNKAIRHRDSFDGMFYDICTGDLLPVSQMDAGHYFPISTSSALRFEPDNVHGESIQSNRYDPNHLKKYKPNLINKIGQKRFDELEARSHEVKHWSKEELLEIIKIYRKGIPRLENVA